MLAIMQEDTIDSRSYYGLGAALIDDDVIQTKTNSDDADQDYWGSSMNLTAVLEKRVFGVFGVARNAETGQQSAIGLNP